ncbi:MAG: EAL domain-containing protein [Gammaproteobacteria bacterium]|nr:EAL domain-containing protein [Gammaproteobacteria bacterium]
MSRFTLHLKTVLPLLMFGVSLFFSLLMLLVADVLEQKQVIAEAEAQLREKGARLTRLAELDLVRDPMRLEREIMLSAAENEPTHIALFDPQGTVRYASQLEWLGRMAREVAPRLDAERYASIRAGIEPVLMRDGLRLMIWVPYADPPRPGELSSSRRGLIYIARDLSNRIAVRRMEILRSELPLLGLGLLLVMLFAFWLNRGVTTPLQALDEAMGRVMSGDLNVRVGRRGVFELADLTASFDRMVEWLARETDSLRQQRNFNQTLLQALPALVVVVDGKGDIVLVNLRAAELLGGPQKVLQGQSFAQFVPEDERSILLPVFPRLCRGDLGTVKDIDTSLIATDGSIRRINWLLHRVEVPDTPMSAPDAEGCGALVLMVGEDVTLQRLAEARLHLAQTVFDHISETLMITDPELRIVAVNPAFSRILGYTEAEVLGKTPALFQSGLHDAAFYRQLWHHLLTTGHWQGEIWDRRKDGTLIPLWQSISVVRDTHGRLLHYVANASDLSALKQAQERSAWLAEHDALTGLFNRLGFLARLREALSQATESGLYGAVVVFDLDRFKSINEGRGPQWGDALLAGVGERLSKTAPKSAHLARLAADEFAVLLPPEQNDPTTAAEVALRQAEVLRAALRLPLEVRGESFQISASLGIALYPPQEPVSADHCEDVLNQATLAMHTAKTAGGERVEFFERAMGERVRNAFDLERALARTLAMPKEEQPFQLFLQPQVDSVGELRGFEALVRWYDPEQGMISPAQFIPIAEQSGLISALGEWVLDRACYYLGQLGRAGRTLSMAVNISPRQFAAADFVTRVSEALTRHGAAPEQLVLEVTEGLLIDNPGHTIATMLDLARLGVRFSIDDFGTGYSSLAYLKRLPIHELKIDRSFIRDLPQDSNDAVIVETIIAMAAHLKLAVVAEGVETEAQAAFLRERGQVIAQGFLYGRPEPAEDWLGRVFAGGGGEKA